MYSYFGYAFAAAGFRVLLPEADMHGSRYDGDERRRLAHFWDILKSNIDELPSLYDHFLRAGLILDGRVGVAGASLGGMTALGAKARYPGYAPLPALWDRVLSVAVAASVSPSASANGG